MNESVLLGVELRQLRLRLGLSLHAMAELLYTSQQTYANWESGSRPRKEAASRITRFLSSAQDQMQALEDDGVDLTGLMPLNLASSALGIPLETLFHAYRDDAFQAHDLGILGIWVSREDVNEILDAVLG